MRPDTQEFATIPTVAAARVALVGLAVLGLAACSDSSDRPPARPALLDVRGAERRFWVLTLAGEARALPRGRGDTGEPVWSPDGRRIALSKFTFRHGRAGTGWSW